MGRIILVTGTREYSQALQNQVTYVLSQEYGKYRDQVVLVHGRATGADEYADQFAARLSWFVWDLKYLSLLGKAGGSVRNDALVLLVGFLKQRMAWSTVCHAFPGPRSRGTYHCMTAAKDVVDELHEHNTWWNKIDGS